MYAAKLTSAPTATEASLPPLKPISYKFSAVVESIRTVLHLVLGLVFVPTFAAGHLISHQTGWSYGRHPDAFSVAVLAALIIATLGVTVLLRLYPRKFIILKTLISAITGLLCGICAGFLN